MTQPPAFAVIADSSRLGSQLLRRILDPLISLELAAPGADILSLFDHNPSPRLLLINHDWPDLEQILEALSGRQSAPQVLLLAGRDNIGSIRGQISDQYYADIVLRPFEARDVVNAIVRCISVSPREDAGALPSPPAVSVVSGVPLSSVLERDLAFCKRHGLMLSAMAVQLNNYDVLCADVGRPAVEEAQQRLEQQMRDILRSEDSFCLRQPGLLILSLPGTPPLGARVLAHRICAWLSHEEFQQQYFSIHFSVNIGIHCCVPGSEVEPQSFLSETAFTAHEAPEDDQNHIHLSEYAQAIVGERSTTHHNRSHVDSEHFWQTLEALLRHPNLSDHDNQDALLSKLAPILVGLSENQRLKLVDDLLMGTVSPDGAQ